MLDPTFGLQKKCVNRNHSNDPYLAAHAITMGAKSIFSILDLPRNRLLVSKISLC